MTKRFHGSRHGYNHCRNTECEKNRRGGESHTAAEVEIVREIRKPTIISVKQAEIYKCLNCGTVVSTACVEYFCPLCRNVIVSPQRKN